MEHDTETTTAHQPAPTVERAAARPAIIPPWLFSMKFAIWIAVALAVASVAGILIQEFFPVHSEADAQRLAERLPRPAYQAFFLFHLQDPFRASWFRVLLGALSASLLLCSWKRFRSALRQAFHLQPVREPQALVRLQNSATFRHVSPDVFDDTVARLRRRLYHGTVQERRDERVAALHQGGVARTGPVLLHLGILALVGAGLVSSILGKRSFVEAGPGQTVAIDGSPFALRVDDFQVETNAEGQVKQYRSRLAMLLNGSPVAEREITVNNPLRHAGYSVYQASYGTDPSRAAALVFVVRRLEDSRAAAAPDPAATVTLGPAELDGTHPVPGFPGWEFRVGRFFGHLQLGADGPVNAARDFANPACELEVLHDGRPAGAQWAFLRYGAHRRDDLPFRLEMRDAQPALVSGLEVNTNPGAPLVWFGLALSTLGLVLSFLVQHRSVFLLARPAERGWTLWIAGRSDREQIGFAAEFERLLGGVRQDARRRRMAERPVLQPDAGPESDNRSGRAFATTA